MNALDALAAALRLIRKGAQAQAYIMAGVTADLQAKAGAADKKIDFIALARKAMEYKE